MARDHAAITETCEPLKPLQGERVAGPKPHRAQVLAERLRAAEPLLRKLAPSLLGVFAVTVAAGFTLQILTNRAETLADSATEIEMISLAMQPELTASLSNNRLDGAKVAQQLQRIIPKSKIDQGLQVFVTDEQARIIASLPSERLRGEMLSTVLGQSQPMTVLAENAGVSAILLPNGGKALAMARRIGAN